MYVKRKRFNNESKKIYFIYSKEYKIVNICFGTYTNIYIKGLTKYGFKFKIIEIC